MMLTNPDDVQQVFKGDPRLLHAGEANAILGPLLGHNSVLLLDDDRHLSQRKMLLPPFHGERMRAYGDLMASVARQEIETWPRGEPFALWPRMQAVTLEVIIRAVFGVQGEERLERMRRTLRETLERATDIKTFLAIATLGPHRLEGMRFFQRELDEVNEVVFEEIRDRRARHRPRGARGHPLAAADRPPRGRLADVRRGAARRADDAAGGRPRDHGHRTGLGDRAAGPPPGEAAAGGRRGRGRRGRVHRRRGQGDPAPAPGHPGGGAAAPGADGDRRQPAPRGRARDAEHPADAPPRGHLSRPARLPPRALPRAAGGHLHLDPLRRRRAALPGRELCAVRDEDGAAGGGPRPGAEPHAAPSPSTSAAGRSP